MMTLAETTREIQRLVNVAADGAWGLTTAGAVLRALSARPEPAPVAGGADAAPTGPLKDVADLQTRLGVEPDGRFGPKSRAALFTRLSNPRAQALTDADFIEVAADLDVPVAIIRAVRKVEAPRGPFDDQGRPSILYERHVFARNTNPPGKFNGMHGYISGGSYGPGGYGTYGVQYDKMADACALDPEAAFRACSWGAFQVLGENAIDIGYPSAFEMALALTTGEREHLESFVRYVKANNLVGKLRQCRPGNPASCEPFVAGYNGSGYRRFNYHVKLAEAAR